MRWAGAHRASGVQRGRGRLRFRNGLETLETEAGVVPASQQAPRLPAASGGRERGPEAGRGAPEPVLPRGSGASGKLGVAGRPHGASASHSPVLEGRRLCSLTPGRPRVGCLSVEQTDTEGATQARVQPLPRKVALGTAVLSHVWAVGCCRVCGTEQLHGSPEGSRSHCDVFLPGGAGRSGLCGPRVACGGGGAGTGSGL